MSKHPLANVLTQDQLETVESRVGKLKSVSDFVADVYEGLKDSKGLVEALRDASPFLGAVGSAAAEASGPVKFVVKLLEAALTIRDPQTLAAIACTAAYQQAASASLLRIFPLLPVKALIKPLAIRESADEVDLLTLSFETISGHAFVTRANEQLAVLASAAGFGEDEIRRLLVDAPISFASNLKALLTHPDTAVRFSPWTALIEFGNDEHRAVAALGEHLAYQRLLFREAPVLRIEPFALKDVYVPQQCGRLTWKEIRDAKQHTAFDEEIGGRANLLETTLNHMRDPRFDDAIVIQGVAGAGKSSFSLALCDELAGHGFRPIRVRLRDVDPTRPIFEALAAAVTFGSENASPTFGAAPTGAALFCGGSLFDQAPISFGEAKLSPWVVILDGWDELQTGSLGFHRQLEAFLKDVRSQLVNRRGRSRVQVILTGRPSHAVHESRFLHESTPVLTIRPLDEGAFQDLVSRVHLALELAPIGGSAAWSLSSERAKALTDAFSEASAGEEGTALDVLGQPLLAMLAIRLLGQHANIDADTLLADTTSLMKNFVDLMCEPGHREDPLDPAGRARLPGKDLRPLLRETAAAITIYGRELIPTAELVGRLELLLGDELAKAKEVDASPIAVVLIAFFFHVANKELGSEFIHKSFREYLFAECIVEHLFEYALTQAPEQPPRALFWREFDSPDPRHQLVRSLAMRLGPQWLAPEVRDHIQQLLERERSSGTRVKEEHWIRLRNGMADLWAWWAEGVLLRPQPIKRAQGAWEKIYAQELAIEALTLTSDPKTLAPIRVTAIDSHLGDALVQITAMTHAVCPTVHGSERPYQTVATTRVFFTPFAEQGQDYAKSLIARVNAAGWRPGGAFPAHSYLAGTDHHGADLAGMSFAYANLSHSQVHNSNLSRSNLNGADLSHASFLNVSFRGSAMAGIRLRRTRFQNCQFTRAIVDESWIEETKFLNCDMRCASFDHSDIDSVTFQKCDAKGASFFGVNMASCTLVHSDFREADFQLATCDTLPTGTVECSAVMHARNVGFGSYDPFDGS